MVPRENLADVDALSEDIKEGIHFHYVSRFDEVFQILFPGVEMGKSKVE